jgi:hypothetical protein
MNATLQAVLSDSERLLVAETEPAELAALDEDAAVELHGRVRRQRNKYVGQYRRSASVRVAEKGARGQARPAGRRAALKAEAFEEALARVSRRVAVLARQSAARLRGERIATARAAKQGTGPAQDASRPSSRGPGNRVTREPVGERALRNPTREHRRAGTQAKGARRQARRDYR